MNLAHIAWVQNHLTMNNPNLRIGLVGLALFTLLVLAPNLLLDKRSTDVETLGVMRAEDTTNWNLYVGFGLVNNIGPRTKSSYWVTVDSLGASFCLSLTIRS